MQKVEDISVEGVILPNIPLSNIQLTDAVNKLKINNFRGVFLRDQLPIRSKAYECGILNLDDSSGKGTHWVAWTKNKSDKWYFDSYGLSPPTELINYLGRPIYYNSERIQPDNEVFCGHLCLYVLKKIQDGNSFQEVINNLY